MIAVFVLASYNNTGSSSIAMLHNTRRITMPGILATTTIWRQDTDDDPYCLPSPTNIDLFLSQSQSMDHHHHPRGIGPNKYDNDKKLMLMMRLVYKLHQQMKLQQRRQKLPPPTPPTMIYRHNVSKNSSCYSIIINKIRRRIN